ncbi:hypothetical protein [Variovorax boronicumulans]|uniref:hypothetical protein n=1 Tax=Variovorax boronicumulans TaxID=436515 RepID=UPI001112E7B7|nr:hypothetical protein [Variovorax boronicumulans]
MATSLNTSNNTAEKFTADVAALLPFALPELQKLGFMKTCAHCGKPFDGGALAVHVGRDQGQPMKASILALCKADRTSLTKTPPNDWAHVSETSGLFPAQSEWARLVKELSYCAIVALHKVDGGITLAPITSAPAARDAKEREQS